MEENQVEMNPTGPQNEEVLSLDDSEGDPCVLAQRHVNECLGRNDDVPLGECDQEAADELFSMSCQELHVAVEDQKEDGTSWLDRLHCRIGVLHFCPVPECKEIVESSIDEACINALEFEGCAQCAYYYCLEEEAQCGPNGYFLDFVGKYCVRFTQVTYPRLSQAGKDWMAGVRECLITNMESGYEEGESCTSIEKRGIADHITCYVDTGICSLPIRDWIKILSTISPLEFPFMQAVMVGNECIKSWFR